MALARSASGPGGLSINTGSTNIFGSNTSRPPASDGLFGSATTQPAQPAQTGGLFGTAPSQPQAGSLLGGFNSQPQQQQGQTQKQTGGELFGQTSAQPGGGIFGSNAAQTQQQQGQQQASAGGLFGQTSAQAGGGLFGSSTAQPQPQQQQPLGGSLFGSNNTGSAFGNTTNTQPQQQQQQQQQSGGLFGSQAKPGGLLGASTSQSQPAPQGSTFGGVGQQPSGIFGVQQTSIANSMSNGTGQGLFGQFAAQQQNNTLGQSLGPNLTMGLSANQQQQTVPGVRIDLSNIRPTTRFNDVLETVQKDIRLLDDFIQQCIRYKEEVDAFMPSHGEQLSAIPNDVNFVTRKFDGVRNSLQSDLDLTAQFHMLTRADVDNARLSFKVIDNLKLPAQYHQAGLWSTHGQATGPASGGSDVDAEATSDLIGYFNRTTDDMDRRMKTFDQNLGAIELHLHGLQSNMQEQLQRVAIQSQNGAQAGVDQRLAELVTVLRDFEAGILQVAGGVGAVREQVTELQLGEFIGNGLR